MRYYCALLDISFCINFRKAVLFVIVYVYALLSRFRHHRIRSRMKTVIAETRTEVDHLSKEAESEQKRGDLLEKKISLLLDSHALSLLLWRCWSAWKSRILFAVREDRLCLRVQLRDSFENVRKSSFFFISALKSEQGIKLSSIFCALYLLCMFSPLLSCIDQTILERVCLCCMSIFFILIPFLDRFCQILLPLIDFLFVTVVTVLLLRDCYSSKECLSFVVFFLLFLFLFLIFVLCYSSLDWRRTSILYDASSGETREKARPFALEEVSSR